MGAFKQRTDLTSLLDRPISGGFGLPNCAFDSWFKLLLPGQSVKRWLLVSGIGILCISLGLGIWLTRVPIDLERATVWLQRMVQFLPGPAVGAIAIVLGLFLAIWGQIRAATSMTDLVAGSPDRHSDRSVSSASSVSPHHLPKVVLIGGGKGLSSILRGLKHYRATVTATIDLATDRTLSASFKRKHRFFSVWPYQFSQFSGENFPIRNPVNRVQTFEPELPWPSRVPMLQKTVSRPPAESVGIRSSVVATEPSPRTQSPSGFPEGSMLQELVRAIQNADYIIIGPGSLHTHLIPNLVVPEIRDAIAQAKAPRVYVCNIMTEPGETDGYTVAEHLRAIHRACDSPLFDAVLVQKGNPSARSLMHYAQKNIHPVYLDREEVEEGGCHVISADVMQEDEKTGTVHHHPQRLARVLLHWYEENQAARSATP